MLGDRDQRMTMQRMTALASQYRRRGAQQPDDQQRLIPRHTPSQQGEPLHTHIPMFVVFGHVLIYQLVVLQKSFKFEGGVQMDS